MAEMAHPTPRSARFAAATAIPRQRGAVSGILLIALGIWGALVPFFGPAINLAFTPDTTWTYTNGRLWLNILPGAVAVLAGLGVLGVANRLSGVLWGWLAALSGAWFVVGPIISRLWTDGRGDTGSPTATTTAGRALQEIACYPGTGAAIIFLGGVALGRFTVAHRPKPA